MDIRLTDIVMQFPGTRALDGVCGTFRSDEVHGLIGENGTGKSTLVNILGGSLQPSQGQIAIGDRPVCLASPHDALLQGIAHVSQKGSLVPGLTGAENILLGHEPRLARVVIRKGALRKQAADLVTRWFPKAQIDHDRPVATLPMADRGRRYPCQGRNLCRDAAAGRAGHGDIHRLVGSSGNRIRRASRDPLCPAGPAPEIPAEAFSEGTFITAISGVAV